MKADILSIGNELLTGLAENTNAGYLSRRLWESGIMVREQRVIPDDLKAINRSLKRSLANSELVICTGGLGPTDDDVTREAVAGTLGRSLTLDRSLLQKLEHFFAGRGYKMPDSNQKQAMIIEGSIVLDNPHGTAPGALIEEGSRSIVLLPGPPGEMKPMFEHLVLPHLASKIAARAVSMVKTLRCVGIGESMLETIIKEAGEPAGYELSLAARGLEVALQLKARGKRQDVQAVLDESADRLRRILGASVYGEDDRTLAGAVGDQLRRKHLTISFAESCSGGLLADAITDMPGSSKFFQASMVTYSEAAKVKLLGVDPALLEMEGAVSEATAVAMAQGVRRISGSDLGVGITGIAGPDSDRSGRPVGTVYLSLAREGGEICRQLKLHGTRRVIKERSVQAVLALLWHALVEEDPS